MAWNSMLLFRLYICWQFSGDLYMKGFFKLKEILIVGISKEFLYLPNI
jgi:hypothetical protein